MNSKKLSLNSLKVKSFTTTHAMATKGGVFFRLVSGGDDCTDDCETIDTISEGIGTA